MLFKTKPKVVTQAQTPPPQPQPPQTLDLSLSLEPSLSEKMYHILNQGPLGLVSLDNLDDDDDRCSVDMMAILEEGPRRSEDSVDRFRTPDLLFGASPTVSPATPTTPTTPVTPTTPATPTTWPAAPTVWPKSHPPHPPHPHQLHPPTSWTPLCRPPSPQPPPTAAVAPFYSP